jgi:hypothetical protein
MSNLTLVRIKNWLREKWPLLTLAAAFLAVAALGFGVGYIAADQANRAPIIINQVNPH